MLLYAARRLILAVPILLGVSVCSFLIIHLVPGNPAVFILGEEASPQAIQRLEEALGLHRPLHLQYLSYLARLLRGDLGDSFLHQRPVSTLLLDRFPATVELAVVTLIVAVLVAIPLGVLAAIRQYRVTDAFVMSMATIGVSAPFFWLAVMLIIAFSYNLKWFPSAGRGEPLLLTLAPLLRGDGAALWDSLRRLVLPVVSLAAYTAGFLARMTRSQFLEVMHSDYVRTARAKGLSERVVLFRHVLRNALLPIITVLGLQLGTLLGGAVVTETVFAWPGLGRLVVQSLKARDYPTVQGAVLMTAVVFTLVNVLVDVVYAYVNPRIRYQ